jgi:hypothetical protein
MKLKGLRTPEIWTLINNALTQFKEGMTGNPEALADDREFYERVIEASKIGLIEL